VFAACIVIDNSLPRLFFSDNDDLIDCWCSRPAPTDAQTTALATAVPVNRHQFLVDFCRHEESYYNTSIGCRVRFSLAHCSRRSVTCDD